MIEGLFADCFLVGAPDAIALDGADRRWTYAELRAACEAVAAGLLRAGVRAGDRVAGLYRDHVDVVRASLGCARLGAVYVPIDWDKAPAQVEHVLADTEAAAILLEERFSGLIAGYARGLPAGRIFVSRPSGAGPHPPLDDLDGPRGALPDRLDDAALGLLPFTSGSTARAKGVMLTWAALRAEIRVDAEGFRLTAADRVLVTASLDGSCAFVDMAMSTLFIGGRVVQRPFDPDAILDLVERERITMWGGGPTQVRAVVEAQRARPRDLGSLRLVWVGGDRASEALRAHALEVLGRPIIDHYGITEVGLCIAQTPALARAAPGSCGVPWPGVEVRLVGDDGRELGPDAGPGALGEFWFRAVTAMSGYWRDPGETSLRLREGWYRSGDLGRIDAEGRYWFVARRSDTLKRDGLKISALEVESALERHPGVLEAGVIGVPDGDLGEKPRAYVTPRPRAPVDGAAVDAAALDRFLCDHLGDHWRPKEYVFVAELPRTPAGKVDRRRLRESAGLDLTPGSTR